jgi:hypothetical protein
MADINVGVERSWHYFGNPPRAVVWPAYRRGEANMQRATQCGSLRAVVRGNRG